MRNHQLKFQLMKNPIFNVQNHEIRNKISRKIMNIIKFEDRKTYPNVFKKIFQNSPKEF